MKTIEYGTYTGPALEGERLHRCLIDLQDSTIRKHHIKRPSLSVADYEDLYARAMLVLLEKHPDASFPAPQAVVSWLDTTISHAAIDVLRRRNVGRETRDTVTVSDARGSENEPIILQPVDSAPTPEQHALLNEDRLTLTEFIASLDPEDRKISLLHLHPGSRMKLRQIARVLDLPVDQVNTVLKRVDKRFSRYVALEVDAVCALRERDLAVWKRTGEMPPALRWHARRCSTCNAKIEAGRSGVYRSLLPPVGVVGLPAAGGLGLFSRLYRRLGSRALVTRTSEAVSRARKAGGLGAGSGGALISAKTVVATAVVATAAAGAGVIVVQETGGARHATRTQVSGRRASRKPARSFTSAAHVRVLPAAKPRTATKTATNATRPSTTSQQTRSTAVARAPLVPRTPVTTSTTSSTASRTVSQPNSGGSSTRTSSARKSSSATAKSNKGAGGHSGSSATGGLPDLQQTEQQP
jgi:RNA polymerase sigma factor (sigma-70 family)